MLISSIAIIGFGVYLFCFKVPNALYGVAIATVISGGIGNMIDRVRLGYVIDFIDFCAFPSIWMWVFNIADSFVCIGAGLLVLWTVLDLIRESREEKAKRLVSQTEGEDGADE
jgi:signal peptidase II